MPFLASTNIPLVLRASSRHLLSPAAASLLGSSAGHLPAAKWRAPTGLRRLPAAWSQPGVATRPQHAPPVPRAAAARLGPGPACQAHRTPCPEPPALRASARAPDPAARSPRRPTTAPSRLLRPAAILCGQTTGAPRR
nr:homeobox protein Hox-A3-like [Aegilops tauschii subsp. strangulata]